jgi:hypothetical protein
VGSYIGCVGCVAATGAAFLIMKEEEVDSYCACVTLFLKIAALAPALIIYSSKRQTYAGEPNAITVNSCPCSCAPRRSSTGSISFETITSCGVYSFASTICATGARLTRTTPKSFWLPPYLLQTSTISGKRFILCTCSSATGKIVLCPKSGSLSSQRTSLVTTSGVP